MLTVFFLGYIIFSKEVSFSKIGFGLTAGVVLLYYLSAVFSGYDTGFGVVQSARPFLLLTAVLSGAHLGKKSFMKSLITASAVLGVIGLLSLCRVVEFKDFVYVYDGLRSLQSTMQYANTTAVVLIGGIFSVRALQRDTDKSFVYSASEIVLTVCMLFTHSKIAIAVYIVLTVAELLMLKEGIPVRFIIHSFSSVILYLAMGFLIDSKLSFLALVLCIVAVLLISEKSASVKKTVFNVRRPTAVLTAVGVFAVLAVALCFTDISTIMIRLLYYMDGMKALIHNPLFGLSPGGWEEYQYNYQSAQYFVSQVHNGVLQVGLDAGVLAMVLFVALIAATFAGLINKWRKDRQTNDLYVLLIFSTLVLHGFFDFDFSYGNILIILGVCISYGMPCVRMHRLKIGCRALAGVGAVFLVCMGVSRSLAYFADAEAAGGNHQRASDLYDAVVVLTPWNTDALVERSLCREKAGVEDMTAEVVIRAFDEHRDNRDIIMKAMNRAAVTKDFDLYVRSRNRLLECVPMQQNTYSDSISYLDGFRQEDLIDETVYLKEKNFVISGAMDANGRMSGLKKYLDFGTDIDISDLN